MPRLFLATVGLLAASVSAAVAEDTVVRFASWRVVVPNRVDCSKSVTLTADGPATLFDATNAESLQRLRDWLRPEVKKRCSSAATITLINGDQRYPVPIDGPIQLQSRPAAQPSPSRAAPPAPTEVPVEAAPPRPAAQPGPTRATPPPPAVAPAETASQRPAALSREPAAINVSVAGTWIGVYQVYPSYVQLTLSIANEPGSNREVPAQIRVEGLKGKNAPQMGVSGGTVRYQAAERILDVTTVGRDLPLLQFHAVYDAERRVFAGYRVGASSDASPYFLLVRQGQEGRSFDRINDMPDGSNPRPSIPFGLGGDSPSEGELRTWASQIFKEYPDIDPYRTESGSLNLMARNLFRDEYFKSYFGKPYDDLSNRDLARINGRLEGMPPPRANFPEDRANGAARSVARGFWVSVGTYSASDITLSVVAMRSISGWMNQTLQRLGGIEPDAGAFRTLAALQAEERGVLGTFWPSERAAFVRAVGDRRARIADPVLIAAVDQQVGAASRFDDVALLQQTVSALARPPANAPAPASPPGRRPMVAVPAPVAAATNDLPSVAAMASEAVRTQLRTKVDQKIAVLVADEAGREDARLASPAADAVGGTSGLEESARVYGQLQAKYGSFQANPAVQSLFATLGRRRRSVLQSAEAELDGTIRRATTERAVDDVLTRFLNVPSDRLDPVGGRLVASADTKKQQIRLAQQQAAAAKQQAVATKARILEQRTASVAARRRTLSAAYGVELPTFEDLFNVLWFFRPLVGQVSQTDKNRFVAAARDLGFTLSNLDGSSELYSDINMFKNARGHQLTTVRTDTGVLGATLEFPDADARLIELYAAELQAGYREMFSSAFDLSDREVKVVTESEAFVKSGSAYYWYKVDKGTLSLHARLNDDGKAPIVAERLTADTVLVNSYTELTDVRVRKGERLRLMASGNVTLGVFAGRSGPGGIDGFETYRSNPDFPIGALLARIGEGEWFAVGSEVAITAPQNGVLSLRINDNERSNNDGAFEVRHVIDPPNP